MAILALIGLMIWIIVSICPLIGFHDELTRRVWLRFPPLGRLFFFLLSALMLLAGCSGYYVAVFVIKQTFLIVILLGPSFGLAIVGSAMALMTPVDGMSSLVSDVSLIGPSSEEIQEAALRREQSRAEKSLRRGEVSPSPLPIGRGDEPVVINPSGRSS
jgi:hypothetical protein